MLTKRLLNLLFAGAAILALAALPAEAQVVSSGMTGTVTDKAGEPVAGATVTAVHTPTNTTFTGTTGTNGRFAFRGLPVGGPYRVTANASGYEIEPLQNVQTALGEDVDVSLVARPEVVQLEKYAISASRSDLDANATGASTVLNNRRILAQPSVSRSFTDLIKTNPFVGVRGYPQLVALGMNNRYNSIMLDGAPINDTFGLNSSGLFSAFNPFSLDAVEQFSISLTPYDARQTEFAGASVNVVSKRGTNEFHGSVYDIFTDQNWQGPDEFGPTIHQRSPLKERTYGFTLGGPIIPDKLFFFVNWEKFIQDSSPTHAGYTPDSAFIDAVTSTAASLPGSPDIGTFGGSSTSRKSDYKRLAKLDWNITQNHRLSVRYSDTQSGQPSFGSFNYSSFSQPVVLTNQPSLQNGGTGLSSSFYNLATTEKVWSAQLFSDWTSDLKTEFDYSNVKQDSVRAVPLVFPEVRIFNVPGTSQTGAAISSNDAFRFGSEISSQDNALRIKTQTAAGSADYTWNAFTISGGADYEASDYYDLFRQSSYGVFDYWNLADFQADKPFGFERAVVQAGLPTADISKYKRTGVFSQVKWDPNARFNLTFGLRFDFVGSPIVPPENAAFKTAFGLTNAGTVDGTTTPQPRLSFNYALDEKRTTQIRGGYGVFLGRNPWVWISNSYGNTGVGHFNITNFTPNSSGAHPNTAAYTGPTLAQYLNGSFTNSDPAYAFDPSNPVGTTNTTSAPASVINLVKPGLKLPTIARGNIAVDRKLPFLDATATVEYIYTEQLDALFVDNMNLKQSGAPAADGRIRFAGSTSVAPLVPGFLNVLRTRDVHAGESGYISFQIDHPFRHHWAWNVAYTHGHATEATSLNSSVANSNWTFNPVFNQNTVEVARSDYEIKDRVQGTLSREFVFRKNFITTVSLYYEARSGQGYSWVYSGDLNNDGVSGNDLIAVPSGADDARFDFSGMTAAQRDAYIAFIQSSGLAKYAGGYAPRNASLTPWQNRLDLNLRQEIPVASLFGTHVRLEAFLDFLNFGSWLDKHLFNYVEELNTGTTFGGLTRVLGNASYTAAGLIKPTATFASDGSISLPASSLIVVNNTDTRWRIQGGVSLKF